MIELEVAWKKREASGELKRLQVLRIFHGPGEGSGPLRECAIDRFGKHAWVTVWGKNLSKETTDQISGFLKTKFFQSAVVLNRLEDSVPEMPKILFGEPPSDGFIAYEGSAKFKIRLLETRHPGLFLDHEPLRRWLLGHSRDLRVLNTFAYTGSLSVASGLGRASHVTTLDLSKATIEWAKENWSLNELGPERGDFIYGDVFEWLPRFEKKSRFFDLIILDPPSFSRGKAGLFSTSKDLKKIHRLALALLNPKGYLVSSINSAGISREAFFGEVMKASQEMKIRLKKISDISLPPSFPVREDSYLKGLILQRL